MKKAHLVSAGVLLAGSWGSPILAGPTPSLLQGVTVSVEVSNDRTTGIFTYRYRVFNPATNDGQIRSIDIEISRGPGDAVLSRDRPVNGPRYSRHTSEDAYQRVPMVPVGISGPEGWTSGLGFDASSPLRGFAGWGSIDEPFRILPGQTLKDFQLTSYGLPALRQVQTEPSVEPPEGIGGWKELNAFFEQFTYRTVTVGPKAPPKDFVPIEFLNYLITVLHDSRQTGWVKGDGIHYPEGLSQRGAGSFLRGLHMLRQQAAHE
jgi:hypothetical protein